MIRPTPRSTLFPYTTLFRSAQTTIEEHAGIAQKRCSLLCQLQRVVGDRNQAVVNHRRQECARIIDTLELTEKRSEEHTSELQSLTNLVCRLLLEKKKKKTKT